MLGWLFVVFFFVPFPLQFSLPLVTLGLDLNGINSSSVTKWFKVIILFFEW